MQERIVKRIILMVTVAMLMVVAMTVQVPVRLSLRTVVPATTLLALVRRMDGLH